MSLRWTDIAISVTAGLLLGAIVHLAIVLRIPTVAREDAFSRYALLGAEGEAEIIPPDTRSPSDPGDDPSTVRGACAWDLLDGPVRINMPVSGLVQTLGIHDRNGRIIYSLTDRAAVRGAVSLIVMSADQREERRVTQLDDPDDDVIEVITPTERGLAVVRAVATSPAWRDRATEAVTSITCVPAE